MPGAPTFTLVSDRNPELFGSLRWHVSCDARISVAHRRAIGSRAHERTRLLALFLSAVWSFHCADFYEGEFECELAVSRLQECCPGLSVDVWFCEYEDRGCDQRGGPVYSLEESRCVQDASCESIVAAKLCEHPEELGGCQ